MASSAGKSSLSQSSAHSMGFCSTSSSLSPFGDTEIDTDGFLKSSHRVGGPFLCSLPSALIPAHSLPIPGNDSAMRHEIETMAREVLNELHLEFLECQVNGRHSKVEPEPASIPTVVIQMPNRPQPELWCYAARKVHQKLEGRGYSGFSVELIEATLLWGIYCSPVEPHHSIFSKWRNVVEEIIRRSDTREWTGMDCWRYGTNVDRKSNPITVIVRVARSSKGPFTTAARFAHGILASFDETGVDVLFQKDGKRRFEANPKALPLESTSGKVYPGVSIGIHSSEAGSATLGGLVQLRFKGKSDWSTYGLTCFHCIWPPENHRENPKMRTPEAKDALQRWANWPLTMRDNPSLGEIAKRILRVDHPSPRDLRTTIESLEMDLKEVRSLKCWRYKKEIDKGDDGWVPDAARREYEQMIKVIRAIEDKREPYSRMLTNGSYYLGHIVAGSGMNRTRVNKDRLRVAVDWALIQINQNRIHRQTQGEVMIGNTSFLYGDNSTPAQDFFYTNDRAFESGVILKKSGRSSHLTSTKCNILKSAELDRLKPSQGPGYGLVVSWSTKIPAGANHFAEPGDSGAWIFSPGGYLFGIVTGGDVAQGTTYVCRTEDLFSDIKDITGAVDVRIAPSSAS